MHQTALLAVFALSVVLCYGSVVQLQMPEAEEIKQLGGDEDLQAQITDLQKNVTTLWNYIYELRSAVSHHITHLRQHQVELETSMHRMEHLHENEMQSNAMHHHSGEHHSHSGEHHSHSDEHSHGSDHSHDSHGSDHTHGSHGSDHTHGSHGSDQTHGSHGSDHTHGSTDGHSHSGEHHHSDEHGYHSHSYSHSHSSHDHSKEDSHSHGGQDDHHDHGHDQGQDHKDSHETEDVQQTPKVDPVAEPIVTATTRQEHTHHHHSYNSDSMNLLNEHSHHHHHDHSHDSRSSSRNRTVVLPKYSEYGLYDLAMCRVQPNTGLPEEQRQNIFGTITMWQKKSGGPLNFHVRVQGFNVGDHAHHQQTVQTETEEQDHEAPQAVSHTHGFHIHTNGDLSNGCQSTGPHYNPKGVNHGKPSPDALSRHVGDLGNIACDEHGFTNIVFSDDVASLRGQYSVIGKSMVIHANEDDLGLGGDAESLKTGNAGTRIACCVIQSVDKIPIRQYKNMKTATQRKN